MIAAEMKLLFWNFSFAGNSLITILSDFHVNNSLFISFKSFKV